MNTPLLRLFQGQPLEGHFSMGNHFFTGICHLCLLLAKDQQESLSLELGPLGHCWHPGTPAKHPPQHGAVCQLASLRQGQCKGCRGHSAPAGPWGQEQWEMSGSECGRGRAVLSGSRIRPRAVFTRLPSFSASPGSRQGSEQEAHGLWTHDLDSSLSSSPPEQQVCLDGVSP